MILAPQPFDQRFRGHLRLFRPAPDWGQRLVKGGKSQLGLRNRLSNMRQTHVNPRLYWPSGFDARGRLRL
jgi:hypothetical protein